MTSSKEFFSEEELEKLINSERPSLSQLTNSPIAPAAEPFSFPEFQPLAPELLELLNEKPAILSFDSMGNFNFYGNNKLDLQPKSSSAVENIPEWLPKTLLLDRDQNHILPPKLSNKIRKCPHCPKTFTKRYNLMSHIKTHEDEKEFACSKCSKAFARSHDLSRHMQIHSSDKKHICPDCGKTFSRNDALKRHLKVDEMGMRGNCTFSRSNPFLFGQDFNKEFTSYSCTK